MKKITITEKQLDLFLDSIIDSHDQYLERQRKRINNLVQAYKKNQPYVKNLCTNLNKKNISEL